ncbi:uncharacterized protein LOC107488936 [Arachis duranensis]|uniref:Uncharacterized protein LOC107488936 n=1 Tax=Arachis duranensis TaxID=130453 RepID=A0A6P4DDG9_ARADU|nr:uncharacterized protein LOC107488936 [Arachis duranensis]
MPEASGNTPNPIDFMAALGNMAVAIGTSNPTNADNWIQAIERALQAQQVPDEQWVEFGTYQLHGEAQHWWQGMRDILQPDRGQMTITMYTSKFEELCRFSHICQGALEDFAEWKCIKYEGGLRSDIQSFVAPMQIWVFSELVNSSRVAKDCVRRAATEKGSLRMPFQRTTGRNFAPRGRQFKRGGYVPQNNQGQGNSRRPNTSANQGRRRGKQPQQDISCHRCGKYHSGPCRIGTGVCYSCGQPGHLASSYPEKKRYEIGRVQQPGRVYTTSSIGAEGQRH